MNHHGFSWKDLRQFGWNLTPIRRATKAPYIDAWPDTVLTDDELSVYLADGRSNVGVVLGESSGGLVDVDLDDLLAGELAPRFLPSTPCIFGRSSKPSSHWFYQSHDEVEYAKFVNPLTKGVILELRGSGRQTMVPPSLHPGGELVEFTAYGPPEVCELGSLRDRCIDLALTTLLIHTWPPQGERHEAYLALAGALLLAGWEVERACTIFRAILDCTIVPGRSFEKEWAGVEATITSTYDTIERGNPPTNWGRLGEILGGSVLKTIRRWVKLGAKPLLHSSGKILMDVSLDIGELMWKCWQVLQDTNTPPILYQSGGMLVRIEELDRQLVLTKVDETRLHNLLTDRIEFYRQGDHVKVPAQPAANLTAKLLADTSLPGRRAWVPELDRIVDHPVLTKDGDLIVSKGYHPECKAYLTEDWTLDLESITLEEALKVIDDLLVDFPLEPISSKTHAVAMLIQPFVRPVIDGNTPMYFIQAPVQGSGKTLLGKVLLMPSLGREALTNPFPEDDTEMLKYLTSKLSRDRRAIFFDNVIRMPDLPSLSAAMTSEGFEARILGSSTSIVVKAPDIWVATGNNPLIHADMARRHVPIHLVPTVENPSLRENFSHPDILGYARCQRVKVVTAICKLIMVGIGGAKVHHRLGSFEAWSEIMGQILTTVGYRDFLQGVGVTAAGASPHKKFIELWWHRFGPEPVFLRELCPLANAVMPAPRGALWSSRTLGAQLERIHNVIAFGVKVSKMGKYIGTDRWAVIPTGVEPIIPRDSEFAQQVMRDMEPIGPTITIQAPHP